MRQVKEKKKASHRSLFQVAQDIRADWTSPYFGAVPYIDAMESMRKPGEGYGADDEWEIIIYFLSNAVTWRGSVAREIKEELKSMKGRKPFGVAHG